MSSELPIVTDRIRLRRLLPSDLANFQQYRQDEAVGRYQGWEPQYDEDAARFLKGSGACELLRPGEWCQVGIADLKTDMLLGDIGMCRSVTEPEVEIGFSVRRESQGLGIASEAIGALIAFLFQDAGIRRIVGVTDARNTSAIRLLENVGMQRLQTNKAVFRGLPCEEHLFVLNR